MSAEIRRIAIELEPGEPISGRLLDGAGSSRAFHGWLELSALLERARQGAQGERHAAAEDATTRQQQA